MLQQINYLILLDLISLLAQPSPLKEILGTSITLLKLDVLHLVHKVKGLSSIDCIVLNTSKQEVHL